MIIIVIIRYLIITIDNMGIDGLTALIKKHAPTAIRTAELSEFSGLKGGIDASGCFYRYCHDPTLSKKINPHINGFYQLFTKLFRYNILPIMICDGIPPPEKAHTLQQRADQKHKKTEEIETLQQDLVKLLNQSTITNSPSTITNSPSTITNSPSIITNSPSIITNSPSTITNSIPIELDQLLLIYKGHPQELALQAKIAEIKHANRNVINFQVGCYDDIKHLCKLMGIPYYRANGEADALCLRLCRDNLIDFVIGEDADMLLYGCTKVLRKLGWTTTGEYINLDLLLNQLQLTHSQFIDLCILCGTDYTTHKIAGIGAVRAYELIKQGLTIETILEKIQLAKTSSDPTLKSFKKYDIPTDFEYIKARKLIQTAHLHESEIHETFVLDLNQVKVDELNQYMIDKCGYKADMVTNHYQQLKTNYNVVKPTKIKIQLKKTII